MAPGVRKAVSEFECKVMRWLCLHPFVRFTYFPSLRYFVFRDFSDTDERIMKGLSAYDLAERAGWDKVFHAMEYYGQMPTDFFQDPVAHFDNLRQEVIRKGQIASQIGD